MAYCLCTISSYLLICWCCGGFKGEDPDEEDLHLRERVNLAHLQCWHHLALRSYENHLRPEFDPVCRWYGRVERVQRLFLISFSSVRSWLWSKLMLEGATKEIYGVHRAPSVALRFIRALGSSLYSIRGCQE